MFAIANVISRLYTELPLKRTDLVVKQLFLAGIYAGACHYCPQNFLTEDKLGNEKSCKNKIY